MAATSLPFKAEYAKSGRAGCKLCKSPIEKGSLRLAVMVQSRFHDGKDAHWFHSQCFFQKHHPPSVGDIEDYESLRYDDQKMIESKVGAGGSGAASGGAAGKGSKAGGKASNDFSVQYAKSSRSECVGCMEFIPKGDVRISKKDYTSEKALMFAQGTGLDRWYHLECFIKIRDELDFCVAASKSTLVGFKDLDRADQDMLKKKLPAITAPKRKLDSGEPQNDAGPSKKIKTENGSSSKSERKEEELIKKQNKQMYRNRDLLESGLKRPDWLQILATNKQEQPDEGGPKPVLDLLADIMTFGAMKRCTDCKTGQFKYKSGVGYQCTGYISEFTKCAFVAKGDVERVPFKVPNDLREHPIFAGKKFKVEARIIPKHAAPVKGQVGAVPHTNTEGPKINKKPLAGFKFTIFGVKSGDQSAMEKRIKKFGGELTSKCSSSVAAAITSKDEFTDSSKDVERAKKYGVPVVSADFVTNIKDVNYKLADEMDKCLLSDWVKDMRGRLKTLNEEFEKPRKTESVYEKTLSSVKLKMKDGAVIDPQSGLDDGPYHVYKEGNLFYNCVLNLTSVEDGLNSFYKLQIIESDSAPREYHVFRAWGRIGTIIGGYQTDPQPSKQDAIDLFLEKYQEKTGNVWGKKFVKKPGKYIMLDIDYGQKDHQKLIPSMDNSQLPLAVQSLVSLIFDVDVMKRTMLEFELDMEKMPLGKMSRKQLLEAYSVLSDSTKLRDQEEDERKRNRLIADVTNRFYTLIPHNFGTRMPPLLDNDELLKMKIEMLDSLMEIELAYELLSKGDEGGVSSIDSHYKTLNADVDILEAHSEEYKIIEKYLQNTHAPTHTNYALKIDQVFKVVRKGENKRYRPFKDLHNRRLLWHGSRVSNFAGIISQGLRIAPPEAPVTGYMFGKGVYFADMVTKSANYCHTSRDNSTGLLLLCEVALGDMHELKQAKETIVKPPKNAHSVKGIGETEPDPNETYTFPDGVLVPYGKPCKSKVKNTSLMYNEYIVYDVAQVNIKYLLKVDFAYKNRR